KIVDPERAQPHDPEILVAHHHRIGRAPFIAGKKAGDDIVDVGLERRLEPVLPSFQIAEHGNVVGGQRILARPESIAELAEIDELRDLRFADDQLRAALDLLVLVRKAVRQRIARIVAPFDDVDELFLDEIHQRHVVSPLRPQYVGGRRYGLVAGWFLIAASACLSSFSSWSSGIAPGTIDPSANTRVGVALMRYFWPICAVFAIGVAQSPLLFGSLPDANHSSHALDRSGAHQI